MESIKNISPLEIVWFFAIEGSVVDVEYHISKTILPNEKIDEIMDVAYRNAIVASLDLARESIRSASYSAAIKHVGNAREYSFLLQEGRNYHYPDIDRWIRETEHFAAGQFNRSLPLAQV